MSVRDAGPRETGERPVRWGSMVPGIACVPTQNLGGSADVTGVKDLRWEVIGVVPVAQPSHTVLKAVDGPQQRGRRGLRKP